VEIHVLQGERPLAKDNTSLGRFYLEGIPPAPRGVPRIEVTFDIDENGILHVSAKDLGTGKEQSIRITAPQKLSKEEIDRMIKESEKFAEEDRKRKELIEERNNLDSIIYTTEKSLREYGDRLIQEDRLEIERALNDAKEKLKSEDINEIRKAKDELIRKSHKLGEVVYKETQKAGQSSAQQTGYATGPSSSSEETNQQKRDDKGEVIDAEYKEG
jgi:molecular chaperone DnaK